MLGCGESVPYKRWSEDKDARNEQMIDEVRMEMEEGERGGGAWQRGREL